MPFSTRFSGPLSPRPIEWDEGTVTAVRNGLERMLNGNPSLPAARDDLVGDVLLRVLAQDRREIADPLAFSATVLRNLIRDRIRELERARRLFDKFLALFPPREHDEPSLDVDNGELLATLLDRASLTRTQEQVVRMYYYEGKSITEIAAILKKNPGTITRHHSRALEKLVRCASTLEDTR